MLSFVKGLVNRRSQFLSYRRTIVQSFNKWKLNSLGFSHWGLDTILSWLKHFFAFFLLLNFQQKVFISSVLFGLHISFRDCPVQIYVYSMHRRRSTFFYYNLHSSIWAAMIEGRIYFCCRNITNYNCLYQRRRKFKNLGEANSNRLSLSCLCSLFYSVKIWEGHGISPWPFSSVTPAVVFLGI